MTVRACMVQNLGKYFTVIAKDGYRLFGGRVTRDVIDAAVKWGWLNDEVVSVKYGPEIIVTIE